MSDPSARTFSSDFRRFFLRGLVVLLPTVLTLWIVFAAYQFVDNRIAEPINRGVRIAMNNTARYFEPLAEAFNPSRPQFETEIAERAVSRGIANREDVRRELRRARRENPELSGEPSDAEINAAIAAAIEATPASQRRISSESVRTELRQRAIDEWWTSRWYMNLIGLIIAIIGVYIAGRVLGGYFGRQIYRRLEDVITSLPVFKQVYPYVKQIVDFLFSDEKQIRFSRVVATEYPRKGIWSIGFMTGPPLRSIASYAGDASVTIFIPSSPTPFTGYTITVPLKDVIEVPISVEEAIRFAVSGGVLVPDHQVLDEAKACGFASANVPLATAGGAAPGSQHGPAGASQEPASSPQEEPMREESRSQRGTRQIRAKPAGEAHRTGD